MNFDLLDKSELSIVGVLLQGADLNAVAATVASVLGFDRREVLVIDAIDETLTVDILRRTVYAHQLLAREAELMAHLRELPGVELLDGARIEARGMLGWIGAPAEILHTAVAEAADAAAAITARIARRVKVFSTGAELVAGQVKDTNWETISATLGGDGFACDHGGALRDDLDLIAGALRRAVHDGYGLVITTGGVGAEAKDQSVEALLKLDPEAATPYTCRFQPGHGRHVKDGVRIAVGEYQGARLVALPGPNDEVRAALEVLRTGLRNGQSRGELAEAIAEDLRGLLRHRMNVHHPTEEQG